MKLELGMVVFGDFALRLVVLRGRWKRRGWNPAGVCGGEVRFGV